MISCRTSSALRNITNRCLGGRASYHAGPTLLKAFVLIKSRPLCVSRKRPENSAYRPLPAGTRRHTALCEETDKKHFCGEDVFRSHASFCCARFFLAACLSCASLVASRALAACSHCVRALMSKDIFLHGCKSNSATRAVAQETRRTLPT